MAFLIKGKKYSWHKKFPLEKVIKIFKKEKGREPTDKELNFMVGHGYYDPMEW